MFSSEREDGKMMRFKSCPRCHGDMYLENDLYSWDEVCLNCGFRRVHSRMHSGKPKKRTMARPKRRRKVNVPA